MTELSIDTYSSRYRDLELEKILRYFIISYKSVLSAVAAVDNESASSGGQRSSSIAAAGDSGLLNHGLKIEVNGSPFRRRFDTKRLLSREPKERREPLRTHSNRELRSGICRVNILIATSYPGSLLKSLGARLFLIIDLFQWSTF